MSGVPVFRGCVIRPIENLSFHSLLQYRCKQTQPTPRPPHSHPYLRKPTSRARPPRVFPCVCGWSGMWGLKLAADLGTWYVCVSMSIVYTVRLSPFDIKLTVFWQTFILEFSSKNYLARHQILCLHRPVAIRVQSLEVDFEKESQGKKKLSTFLFRSVTFFVVSSHLGWTRNYFLECAWGISVQGQGSQINSTSTTHWSWCWCPTLYIVIACFHLIFFLYIVPQWQEGL